MHEIACPLALVKDPVDPSEMRELSRKTCEFAAEVEERLNAGDRRFLEGDNDMAQLKADLATNTEATKRVEDATREMVDFYNSMIGAFKVLNWIGKLAMPIGSLIGMCTALWGAWMIFKNGGKP